MRAVNRARIIGVGMTPPSLKSPTAPTVTHLMKQALNSALHNASLTLGDLNGLISVPSLAEHRFMQAHHLATSIKLLPNPNFICKTLDTGGAGPISALIEADRLIRHTGCDVIAIVAGDAVASMNTKDFLAKADSGCNGEDFPLPSPVIPNGYDRVAAWAITDGKIKREHLAMVSVLMSRNAVKHPMAVTKKAYSLEAVLNSGQVGKVTSKFECARRADGAAAIIVASDRFIEEKGLECERAPAILGVGEASGPLHVPEKISEVMFSCGTAARQAFDSSNLSAADIQFFGLYDCFPICFIKALEAVGLANAGAGGDFVEMIYRLSEGQGGFLRPEQFPINTHGGLLAFGAPWEAPAMYNVIEAVTQIKGEAKGRQLPSCNRALVYGNGGIFSSSAVAILGTKNLTSDSVIARKYA